MNRRNTSSEVATIALYARRGAPSVIGRMVSSMRRSEPRTGTGRSHHRPLSSGGIERRLRVHREALRHFAEDGLRNAGLRIADDLRSKDRHALIVLLHPLDHARRQRRILLELITRRSPVRSPCRDLTDPTCGGRSPSSRRYEAWTKAAGRNRHPSTEGTPLRQPLQLSDGSWFLQERNACQNVWILHWRFTLTNG